MDHGQLIQGVLKKKDMKQMRMAECLQPDSCPSQFCAPGKGTDQMH